MKTQSIKEFFDHPNVRCSRLPFGILVYNGFKIEFSNVDMKADNELFANVKVTKYGRNILVVASHSDDEVLGCGGTIAKLTASGVM